MGNVLNIAKKEFADLISNKAVIIILVVFLFLIAKCTYDYYYFNVLTNGHIVAKALAWRILAGIWFELTRYGSLVCMIIGFSLISSERKDGALNTLLVKPLYRDTILNGKLLGALEFISCTFIFAVMLFISLLFVFLGNPIISIMPDIILRMPLIFILSMMYVTIFLALSMIITILIKNQAFALILSTIIIAISELVLTDDFTGNIYYFMTGNIALGKNSITSFIMELSPDGVSSVLTNSKFFDPTVSLWNSFPSVEFEIIRLVLYMIIMIVLCYIVFTRRDVA